MKNVPRKSATTKAMDLLALRGHSRFELKQKLSQKGYEDEEILQALEHVESHGWLLPPEEMAQKTAQNLHEKHKSHSYISQYLSKKQLPSVDRNDEKELEKAQSLVNSRFGELSDLSFDDKKRINQFLAQRGYDWDTIKRVIHGE